MPGLSIKSLLKYMALPEIMPRFRALFFGGFSYIPFFIAAVFQMVGLLPVQHPYLRQGNIGQFGLRHVMAEAGSNLRFNYKSIDQIVLYVSVLVGMVIFAIQFLALASVFLMQPVMASMPTSWAGFFTVPNTSDAPYRPHDLALMMLDMVFGVPHPNESQTGFFESCVSTSTSCIDNEGKDIASIDVSRAGFSSFTAADAEQMGPLTPNAYTYFPFPFHDGLHKIFSVYSNGLLVIAVMIAMYFVVTVVGETMQTGTPFGKRFNKTWAPIRFVMAFGLLVPLNIGLNSAQYLVLYAAKYGSAFATNGWAYFNESLTTSYTGEHQSLVSVPNIPDMNNLIQFMFVGRTCKYAMDYYILKNAREASSDPAAVTQSSAGEVKAYVLLQDTATPNVIEIKEGTTYQDIADGTPDNTTKIKIRFGVKDSGKYKDAHSSVLQVCGDLVLPWGDGRDYDDQEEYMRIVQEAYFKLVRDLWSDTFWDGINGGGGAGSTNYPAYTSTQNHRYKNIAQHGTTALPNETGVTRVDGIDVNHSTELDAVYVQNANDKAKEDYIKVAMTSALTAAEDSGLWGEPYNGETASHGQLMRRGWAGAGIWYNRIAQVNGQLTAAIFGVPMILSQPMTMKKVASKKAAYDKLISATTASKPEAAALGDVGLLLDQKFGLEFANILYMAQSKWANASNTQNKNPRGNPILVIISHVLGLDGLYNMRENKENATHPLAQLSGVGRSLVESSIRSLGYASATAIFGALGPSVTKQLTYVITSFFITIAMLGLTVGFVLFYILPFLPFIYFFFAVGGWIKGVFEALVGTPLWALAHIRIDGQGMFGQAALNGYFLLFEVFLRPILIVFGMLASISIFAALVNVLNDVFDLVSSNAAGYDLTSQLEDSSFSAEYMRSRIDQFFFTIIYAIMVYMIGMSAFKLVDLIPNNILRWMGQTVASFGDQREDPAQGLTSRASIGSQQVLGKLGGGLEGIAGAVTKTG